MEELTAIGIDAATNPESTTELGVSKAVHGDIALNFLETSPEDFVVEKEVAKRVLRKIDLRILPLLCVTLFLQFLDKSTLSYASIFGIIEDAHLVGTDYSWLSSIFYFGYMISQPISAYTMQHFSPAKCLSFSVFWWGVILFMHVVCDSFAKLMAVRFFLGMAEAIVTPAFLLITSGWYPRSMQPLRMGAWYAFNGVAIMFGGLIAYGLGHIHVDNISPWKWMFIVPAGMSILWSIVLFFCLPTSQLTASFFNDHERRTAIELIRKALLDPITWFLFFLNLLFNVPNSISSFGSLIISNFGFGSLETTLLSMPGGAVEILTMTLIPLLSMKVHNSRLWCTFGVVLVALLGTALIFALPYGDKGGLLAGYWLIFIFPTAGILLYSMLGANVAGHTKKVTTNAVVLIGYCVGNIIGPQFFKSEQKPRYRLAIGSFLVCWCLMLVLCLLFRFYLRRQNKRREAHQEATTEIEYESNIEFHDLTDRQNPKFVYIL
ncbi:MFS transporter [Exophiala viscosa]|uniref:MFS transporter n=1 Tax=Exophiala viscosa TaxID=2486360 RepID=UPI0021A1BC16|nr:MFS transporter [Exophiala viscosa]